MSQWHVDQQVFSFLNFKWAWNLKRTRIYRRIHRWLNQATWKKQKKSAGLFPRQNNFGSMFFSPLESDFVNGIPTLWYFLDKISGQNLTKSCKSVTLSFSWCGSSFPCSLPITLPVLRLHGPCYRDQIGPGRPWIQPREMLPPKKVTDDS